MLKNNSSKEKIYNNIKAALSDEMKSPYSDADMETDIYYNPTNDLVSTFVENFELISGKTIQCKDEEESLAQLAKLIQRHQWKSVFSKNKALIEKGNDQGIKISTPNISEDDGQVWITECEYLISRLGSIMVSSSSIDGRIAHAFPAVHIIIAQKEQIVWDIKDAMDALMEKYKNNMPSMITMIAGPSRTADIEKTLVMGAHGPKEIYVLLINH